jgi:hypothetical protein
MEMHLRQLPLLRQHRHRRQDTGIDSNGGNGKCQCGYGPECHKHSLLLLQKTEESQK